MAEVNANSLPAKTDLGSNDSAIVVDQTTNAGALVDLDVLADKVLDRISSKTYANQVGGSSAATLLAQLSTLNSKIIYIPISTTVKTYRIATTSQYPQFMVIGQNGGLAHIFDIVTGYTSQKLTHVIPRNSGTENVITYTFSETNAVNITMTSYVSAIIITGGFNVTVTDVTQ